MIKKPSFLERLTGVTPEDYDEDEFETFDEFEGEIQDEVETPETEQTEWESEAPAEEGELPIDMYHTDDAIVIRALVAGVTPGDLEISITRDMVTLKGHREEMQEAADDNYFHRELFWGSFSRTILLPDEILIDEAEAREKHGLLEIVLPKVDKDRSTHLKVASK